MSPARKIIEDHPGDCVALWVGPFMLAYDGTPLSTGETEMRLSQPEAEGSRHWKVLESIKVADGDKGGDS